MNPELYKALKMIVKDKNCPAVNYAVDYAAYATQVLDEDELKVQCLYVLNNISQWRGGTKSSKFTKDEVKNARKVIKNFAGVK